MIYMLLFAVLASGGGMIVALVFRSQRNDARNDLELAERDKEELNDGVSDRDLLVASREDEVSRLRQVVADLEKEIRELDEDKVARSRPGTVRRRLRRMLDLLPDDAEENPETD